MSQLALPLQLQDHAVFETYWAAGNGQAVAVVQGIAESPGKSGCWLWGAQSVGKSHLLQAACEKTGAAAVYLPLGDLLPAGPGILDGLADRALLALDDLQCVAGAEDWEMALFTLFNAVSDAGGAMIVASTAPQRESGIQLPDLESRLATLPTFQLRALNETDRAAALQLRARHRGVKLPDETARYLLSRQRRDMGSLYALLDRLDAEALAAQRRLTIPFVKSVLEGG